MQYLPPICHGGRYTPTPTPTLPIHPLYLHQTVADARPLTYEQRVQPYGISTLGAPRLFEKDGATVVVDEVSLEMMSGSTVDYTMELIKRSFVVSANPNAEAGCGCGISFNLK